MRLARDNLLASDRGTLTRSRAVELAVAVVDLCTMRGVVPRLSGPVVTIPPRVRRMQVLDEMELVTVGHGPVLVECEPGFDTWERATELARRAQVASTSVRGWAPHFIELLEPYCDTDVAVCGFAGCTAEEWRGSGMCLWHAMDVGLCEMTEANRMHLMVLHKAAERKDGDAT
jgi:hypothetical protein